MLVSAFVASIGASIAQNNFPTLPVKQAAPDQPALEAVDFKPMPTQIVTPKGGAVWSNGFSDATEWTAGGPIGANPPEFGWSIQSTISSWYNGFQNNMNTSGTFAHFRNGNTTTAVAGPFTLTFNGTIDLTDVPVPHLEFQQYGARFITTQAVQISLNGTTWVTVITNDDIAPLTAGGGAAYPRPMLRRANLAPYLSGDISQVHVRLFWDGALNGGTLNNIDYGWYVDDIMIVPGEDHDLSLDQRFAYAVGNLGYMHTKIPASQVPANGSLKMEFQTKVSNNGVETQNAYLQATAPGYTGDGASKTMISLQKDSLFVEGTPAFTVPTTAGTYNFTLTVKSDNELTNTGDDTATFPFEVTPAGGVMASDFYNGQVTSMTGSFTGWLNPSGDPSIGTWFEIFQTTSGANRIGAIDVGIANISAANQGPYIGSTLYGQIWKYINDDFEFVGITAEYEIQAADFGKTVRLFFDENCISVNAGDDIVVLASFSESAEVPVAMAGESLAGTTIGMDGSSFVTLSPTITDGPYVRVPVVRPVFTCFVGLENNNVIEEDLTVYPNPASELTNVKLTLTGDEDVIVVVRDLAGKTIQTINTGKYAAGSHNISINLDGMAQGLYTVTVSAGNSSVTQKMIVK